MQFEIKQGGAWHRMSTYLGVCRREFKRGYYAEPEEDRPQLFELEPSDYDSVLKKYNQAKKTDENTFEVDETDAVVLMDVVATLRCIWKGDDEITSREFSRFEAEVLHVSDELNPVDVGF